MRRGLFALTALAMLAVLPAAPAASGVAEASEGGFTVTIVHRVSATPDAVWAALVAPARWWSPAHSYSKDARNFSLDMRAGGCFCERWGENSVEHGRVVMALKGQQLRLLGAFGPLQSEALAGALTFSLKAEGKVTVITTDYVVGGHARFALKDFASAVDAMLGEQMQRLAALFPPGA